MTHLWQIIIKDALDAGGLRYLMKSFLKSILHPSTKNKESLWILKLYNRSGSQTSKIRGTVKIPSPSFQEKVNIPEVSDRYSTHPSIQQIKSKFSDRIPFSILFASEEEVYDMISSVDTTKGADYDRTYSNVCWCHNKASHKHH